MLCTNECYNKLVEYYHNHKSELKNIGKSDDYERLLFLVNKLDFMGVGNIYVERVISKDIDILDDINSEGEVYDNIVLRCYSEEQDDFTLILKEETHYDGYCGCSPNDEGYYEEHQCCGVGCDHSEPYFAINYEYGAELRVISYGEYKFFNFLRELNNSADMIREVKKKDLINRISHEESVLKTLREELESMEVGV